MKGITQTLACQNVRFNLTRIRNGLTVSSNGEFQFSTATVEPVFAPAERNVYSLVLDAKILAP